MKKSELLKIQNNIIWQVEREYNDGYNHIMNWISDVQSEVRAIKKSPPRWDVFIDLVKDNIDLERSLFLSDEPDITFVNEEGVLGNEKMENLRNVYKYDFIDTKREEMKEQIIIDNGYYGIAVEVADLYDDDEQQPMSVLINPDTCIPDPKCVNSSWMRFFWFSRKVQDWKLKSDQYNIEGIEIKNIDTDSLLYNSDQARQTGNWIEISQGYADLYEHYTIYDGKKCLTTWVNGRSTLIRYVELGELTKAEKMNPMKCNFNIVFHRRKPYPYRWAGYRMKEDVGNEEDIITQMTNLAIEQARISSYWPDTFFDGQLGIDWGKLQKLKKWGRLIQTNPIPQGSSMSSHIFQKQYAGNNSMAMDMVQNLDARVKRKTGYTDITMGVSPDGQQTKWEIQQLQANAQKSVGWVRSNYLKWEKESAYIWVRMYQLYMPKSAKKIIALFDNGWDAKFLKKTEFITDGKIIIDIKSSNEQKIINEKAVVKMMALAPNILPNLKSEYSRNVFLRAMVDKSEIDGVEWDDIIPYSYDELLALSRVEMLNNNIEVMSWPEAGEDLKTHIDIYEECVKTPATQKLLSEYKRKYMESQQIAMNAPAPTDNAGSNVALNMLSQQQAPSNSSQPM